MEEKKLNEVKAVENEELVDLNIVDLDERALASNQPPRSAFFSELPTE